MLMKVMKGDLSKWRDTYCFWIERLKTHYQDINPSQTNLQF